MTGSSCASLEDVAWQVAFNRRYPDRRFYKGIHVTNFAEALAQRRCVEAFAHGSLLGLERAVPAGRLLDVRPARSDFCSLRNTGPKPV
jgi:acyl-coenzyme A thioesterase PaaI-like protein